MDKQEIKKRRSAKILSVREEKVLKAFVDKALEYMDGEDLEYFNLTLHRDHRCTQYFSEENRKEIRTIFNALIKDTKRHAELLEHIIKLCE